MHIRRLKLPDWPVMNGTAPECDNKREQLTFVCVYVYVETTSSQSTKPLIRLGPPMQLDSGEAGYV